MLLNIAAQGGESQVKKFTITGNNGKVLNVSSGFIELYIHESCLDYTTRASVTLVDTGNRTDATETNILEPEDLNLNAGEVVNLIVDDGYGNRISFNKDYHLRIQRVRDIDEHTGKFVFSLDLYSKECIDNELVKNRVVKRYDGKVSDSVGLILKQVLKTEKNIFIDETLNNFNFLGNTEKPFYKIPWLATRSVPDVPNAKGKYAGYFFYETTDDGKGSGGFHFKSIDKFFLQEPKKKLIYNNTPYVPVGYDGKIVSYSINNTVDLNNIFKSGALSKPLLKSFNPFNKATKVEDTFNDSDRIKNPPKVAEDLDLNNEATRIFTAKRPIGVLPSGSTFENQKKHLEQEDWDIDGIIRQATARYNNLFNTRINITIQGDFSIHAGDILFCDFPEVSSKATKIISNKKSGKYLVIDVGHKITKGYCYTSLNLVRESIYRN